MSDVLRHALSDGEQASSPPGSPSGRVRKKVRPFSATLVKVLQETPDTVTLEFDTASENLDYQPGQFVTVDPKQFFLLHGFAAYLEQQKGKRELPRAYSLASAPHEARLAITIKEEPYVPGATKYPPLLSPLLVHGMRAGLEVKLVGFTGPYVLPEDVASKTAHLVHVVAGSGSVPNFSILKDSLHRGLPLRHTFIYSNKTWADVCYRDALTALQQAHPDRLRVVHTLTRETDESCFGPDVRRGRVSDALFQELLCPEVKSCLVYACGPAVTPYERAEARARGEAPTPRFLESVISKLISLGVPSERIKRESYG